MRNDALRTVIERDRELKKAQAKTRKLTGAGKTFREGSTSDSLGTCPLCRRWYVDSRQGKLAHAQRSPRCLETMERLIRESSQIQNVNKAIREESPVAPPAE